jgi:selenocysteine lyase/cysteine desulfurase
MAGVRLREGSASQVGPTSTAASSEDRRRFELVGSGQPVPIAPSGSVPYCNLDFAASAPALRAVLDAVERFLPWYSSIHRGAGYKSRVASAAYEGARESVRRFLSARSDDLVIFTRNTTDSVNLLERVLPPDLEVVTFALEHHANLLPWRRRRVTHLPVPAGPVEMVAELTEHLLTRTAPALVAVTGASNVTGEVMPLAELAAVAHRHGSRLFVDAAQLAPHRAIDMTATGVDFLALSGHKLYAPFGAGVLVGPPDWFDRADPYLAGGGPVEFVTLDEVHWSRGVDRHEAGSPNVVGAVALGAACDHLAGIGMDRVAALEAQLFEYGRERLLAVPGLELYSTWSIDQPHIGVLTFQLAGYGHAAVAEILSVEHGIGVRDGCFCAHPLMTRLLRLSNADMDGITGRLRAGQPAFLPGAVRASLGLDSTAKDVDRLADALADLAGNGPRWTYRVDPETSGWSPDPDPRSWPDLGPRLPSA